MTSYEFHPYAEVFPMMPADELNELADNIRLDGLHEPIKLFEGKIIDGRNRYLACELAGVAPEFEKFNGPDGLAYVISRNLLRRHLNESQRAMAAARVSNLALNPVANLQRPNPIAREDVTSAARAVSVSERSAQSARAVLANGTPELIAAVDAGEVTVSAAAEVAKLPKSEQKEAVKGGPKKVKETAKKSREGKKKSVTTSQKRKSERAETVKVDAWGIPIQPHAAEAFDAIPKFRELIAAIQTAQRLFNEVASLSGGKFLTLPDVSSFRRAKRGGEDVDRFVHDGLEAAYRQVKAAIPTYTVCPWEFVEAKHPKDCRTCLNLRWTPALGDNIPQSAIDKAKERHGV